MVIGPQNTAASSSELLCYLTTIGRITGRFHTVEIWFALFGQTIYILAGYGERADWVRNVFHTPQCTIRIRERVFRAQARRVTTPDEDNTARRLLQDKYSSPEDNLDQWTRHSLPLAFDLE